MGTTKNITMKQFNGTDYDILYPETTPSQITETIPVNKGGTGATDAATARSNLGVTLANLGGEPAITTLPVSKGGTGQTSLQATRNAMGLGNTTGALPIANGGTGSTTAANARSALGLGAASTYGVTTSADNSNNLITASAVVASAGPAWTLAKTCNINMNFTTTQNDVEYTAVQNLGTDFYTVLNPYNELKMVLNVTVTCKDNSWYSSYPAMLYGVGLGGAVATSTQFLSSAAFLFYPYIVSINANAISKTISAPSKTTYWVRNSRYNDFIQSYDNQPLTYFTNISYNSVGAYAGERFLELKPNSAVCMQMGTKNEGTFTASGTLQIYGRLT